ILAQAGLKHVEFGTEALADRVLASYGKPFHADDVFISHREALSAGLHVAHYLMTGGPGENEDTLRETLTNADRLEKTVFFIFNGIRLYPHTTLYNLAIKEGQIEPRCDLLEPVFYWSPSLPRKTAIDLVKNHIGSRTNWVIGSGPPQMYKIIERLHARGHVGPLWERLIQ
ncbi:MAG TPA: B12-binding domain-containing radical SAM protein, partial [Syntrophaceae bacterium]|nr:B12-binding domain-containing radical SAM protein [Syntrophaceae bacterium]